jgi:hypothetical protein
LDWWSSRSSRNFCAGNTGTATRTAIKKGTGVSGALFVFLFDVCLATAGLSPGSFILGKHCHLQVKPLL